MEYPTDQLSRYTFDEHDVRGELVQFDQQLPNLDPWSRLPSAGSGVAWANDGGCIAVNCYFKI